MAAGSAAIFFSSRMSPAAFTMHTLTVSRDTSRPAKYSIFLSLGCHTECQDSRLGSTARLLHLCRLGLDGDVPDHSTFSENRHGPPNSWATHSLGCARANGRMMANRSDRNWLIPLALSGSKARQNNWAPVRVSHQGQQRRCVKDRIDSCNRALPDCRRSPCIAGTVHR